MRVNGRWVAREARAGAPLLACLFVLVAVLTSVALAGPVLIDRLSGSALDDRVSRAQAQGELLVTSAVINPYADGGFEAPSGSGSMVPALHKAGEKMRAEAKEPLRGLLRPGPLRVVLPPADVVAGMPGRARAQLSLLYADDAPAKTSYAQGRPPGPPSRGHAVEVAVSTAVRDAFGLTLGQRLTLKPGVEVTFTGFFRLPERADGLPLFRRQPGLAAPLDERISGARVHRALAVTDGSGVEAVQAVAGLDDTLVIWRTGLDLGDGRHGGVDALRGAVGQFGRDAGEGLCPGAASGGRCRIAGNAFEPPMTADDLSPLFAEFAREWDRARALASFAIAGLIAVAFATLVVSAQLAVRRHEAGDRLQRARGATPLGVALARLTQTAPAVLLGAAAGYGVTVGTLGDDVSGGLPLTAAVVVLAGLTLPALTWFTVRERRPVRGGRAAGSGAAGSRRLLAESAVLLLAVAGVAAIRVRDGGASGGDPQLAATPVLLGLATVLILMRLYPLPLRWLACQARRGTVAFIALARVGRTAAGRTPALLVLVLTLATAVFGGLISSTATEGRERAAAWNAGGQAAVIAPTAEPAALSRTPGVRHTVVTRRAEISLARATDGQVRGTTDLIGLDAEALRAAAGDSPPADALLAVERRPYRDGPVTVLPALAFGPLSARLGETLPLTETLAVRIVGELTGTAARDPALGPVTGAEPSGSMLLVDAAAFTDRLDVEESAVLVYGDRLDPVALRAAALTGVGPGARVRVLDEELAALRDDGLLRAVLLVYAAAGVTGVLLALLAVVLELLLSAGERGRTAAYLRTLGLGSGPTAFVHFLEMLPMVIAAVAGGSALGLLLPEILGPALPLGEFTGGPGAGQSTDYGLTVLLAVGLAALIALAVAVETLRGRQRALGSVLRVGETR
ncbi:hypothetical protein SRB5_30370 [Streptomyces sp. RB5]|uniref:ABC transport system permease protein n=1 Tax=Streptomyces smaragdinus TaxID=2585196 RepID=A0A7K0CHG1_9ACTN|nr:hypothetical protein [Streptomyces smaragdinus]MQY12898.1 hypothetical protein [Streptomyces smaragdinus]